MAKPPETPPHSDIEGVNRDGHVDRRQATGKPDPGRQLDRADDESIARPDGTDHR